MIATLIGGSAVASGKHILVLVLLSLIARCV